MTNFIVCKICKVWFAPVWSWRRDEHKHICERCLKRQKEWPPVKLLVEVVDG